jgi:hypothetical protein
MPIEYKGNASTGSYVNPFYRQVDSSVIRELNTRAEYYGSKVRGIPRSARGGDEAFPKNLVWSYGKIAYARVKGAKGTVMGTPHSNIMSDRDGNLTLYNAQRNVPNKPLLTGLELSNEGTIGSLLKGKFTFIYFPKQLKTGFLLEGMEEEFFTPGKEVEIRFGWSINAENKEACNFQFKGIISNFNWSIQPDMSISADVSIVSKASIAIGASGDQSVKEQDGVEVKDPAGVPIKGNNLSTLITQDLAKLRSDKTQIGYGTAKLFESSSFNTSFNYYGVGLPFQEEGDSNNKDNPPKTITKTFWYVKLGDLIEFSNTLIEQYETSNSGSNLNGLGSLYRISVYGNITDAIDDIQSAFPIDIYFPDEKMGTYGNVKPFNASNEFLRKKDDPFKGSLDISSILLGTDYIKKTYESFIEEQSTNIPFKNITGLIDALIKKINYASGDTYQFNAVMYEPKAGTDTKAILSIEDSNLPKEVVKNVKPYGFEATIYKPLIKSVSITSHPPGPLAAAAYVQARGDGGSGAVKPNNIDVSTATKNEKDQAAFNEEYQKALKGITDASSNLVKAGFNEAWGETYRGNLIKYKRNKVDNASWLRKAIYPIDLTLTIDGINGFKFGDVIATNLIPQHYNKKYKMVFTITKINHTIKDGMWETVLNTKSRISMDGEEDNTHPYG